MITTVERQEIQTTLGIKVVLTTLLLAGGTVTGLLLLALVWALLSIAS